MEVREPSEVTRIAAPLGFEDPQAVAQRSGQFETLLFDGLFEFGAEFLFGTERAAVLQLLLPLAQEIEFLAGVGMFQIALPGEDFLQMADARPEPLQRLLVVVLLQQGEHPGLDAVGGDKGAVLVGDLPVLGMLGVVLAQIQDIQVVQGILLGPQLFFQFEEAEAAPVVLHGFLAQLPAVGARQAEGSS